MKLKKIVLNSVGVMTALIAGTAVAGVGPITGDSITAPPSGGGGGGTGVLGDWGISGGLSAGYDSTYVFRGHDTGEDLVWTDVNLSKDLGNGVGLNVGAWYGSLAENAYTELDLYAGLSKDFGWATLGVGYTYYWYGQEHLGTWTQEVGASISRSFGPIDVGLNYYYDTEIEGSYLQATAGYSTEIAENVSFELGASVSYGFEYYVPNDDWYDINVRAGIPIKLAENTTLTPYIAVSIPLDGAEVYNGNDNEILYGGASISVSF